MDFLLKQEKLVIEVKRTRKGLGTKEVGEQLKKDGKQLTAAQMRDVAAVSDFEYVKTLDDGSAEGGVFK